MYRIFDKNRYTVTEDVNTLKEAFKQIKEIEDIAIEDNQHDLERYYIVNLDNDFSMEYNYYKNKYGTCKYCGEIELKEELTEYDDIVCCENCKSLMEEDDDCLKRCGHPSLTIAERNR